MSLSRHLQSADLLALLPTLAPGELRERILERGRQWLASHEEETRHIAGNCAAFGIAADPGLIARIQEHLLLHYFEKFLPLCGTPRQLAAFLSEHVYVDDGDTEGLRTAIDTGRGVLLATCHFGAVELIGPALMMRGLPVTGVLRLATEAFSRVVQGRAAELGASGLFGRARFIEIGRPGVAAAVEMAAVLRRHELLLAVFDEETDYSIPVRLLGAQVRGGAGLDRLLRFVNAPVSVMTAFMIRNGDGTYRLAVDAAPDGSVQGMFGRLEAAVREHPEQWYFLHEKIPFAA